MLLFDLRRACRVIVEVGLLDGEVVEGLQVVEAFLFGVPTPTHHTILLAVSVGHTLEHPIGVVSVLRVVQTLVPFLLLCGELLVRRDYVVGTFLQVPLAGAGLLGEVLVLRGPVAGEGALLQPFLPKAQLLDSLFHLQEAQLFLDLHRLDKPFDLPVLLESLDLLHYVGCAPVNVLDQ